VAINLSVRDLADDALATRIASLLGSASVPPDHLTVEITESVVMADAPRALRTMRQLREHGIEIAIDDFGTGYSSLAYLRRLPIVEIKADKSFVTSLAEIREDAVIVRAIIDLAHNLELSVVAEGVEDERTMNLLIEYGCDAAQGYHFSRPLAGGQLQP
jgi:EAL domain-containing protein (putative c-di-GMP-specific phosphodiesterase class I)